MRFPLPLWLSYRIWNVLIPGDQSLALFVERGIALWVEKHLVVGVSTVGQTYILILTHQVREVVVNAIRKAVVPRELHK